MTLGNEDRVDLVVLTWLACKRGKPAKAAALAKDVAALLPDGTAAARVDESLARLAGAGQVGRVEPRTKKGVATFAITDAGRGRATEALGRSELPAKATFKALVKSDIVPLAAGLPATSSAAKPKGAALYALLQLATCAERFDLALPLETGANAAKLALVKLALARSHGLMPEQIYLKKLPTGELPALVAAPLLGLAGTAASKLEKLIETAALQTLGISSTKLLDTAIVKRWLGSDEAPGDAPPAEPADVAPAPAIDLPTFAGHALEAARDIARDGREGLSNLGDKVLIHYAWQRYERMFGALSLEQFKGLLSRANGEGLVLACEDLIPDARRAEFAESEVRVGTSAYHYIRL